jgi:hypothetical protein
MKVPIRTIENMATVSSIGNRETSTRVTTSMMRETAMVRCTLQMVLSTKVIGPEVFRMAKLLSSTLMALLRKATFKTTYTMVITVREDQRSPSTSVVHHLTLKCELRSRQAFRKTLCLAKLIMDRLEKDFRTNPWITEETLDLLSIVQASFKSCLNNHHLKRIEGLIASNQGTIQGLGVINL